MGRNAIAALVAGALAGGIGTSASAQTVAEPKARAETGAKSKPAKTAKSKATAKSKDAGADNGDVAIDAEKVLDEGRRALAQGKHREAAEAAARALTGARKSGRTTARALALRGEAHLKFGRLAEAIADLDGAIWVTNGLQGAEREGAVAARAEAYRQAGIAEPQGGTAGKALPHPGSSPAQPKSETTPPASSGGIGGFFANIFNPGGSKPAAAASTASVGATQDVGPTAAKIAATSSFEPQRAEGAGEAPAVKPARVKSRTAAVAGAAVVAAPAAGGGAFRLQLAAVRSQAEAKAMGEAVRRKHAAVLGSRTFDIDEAVFGNMGRFYRLRIGPFTASVEAEAICATLRNEGHDCMVIDRQ